MTTDPSSNVPPPTPPPAAPGDITKDDKTMGMLAHLLGIVTGFVGPLVIWLVKKERPFVETHAKIALNWQLTLLIGYVAGFILGWIPVIGICLGPIVSLGTWVAAIIFGIKGLMQANVGNSFKYPFSFDLIK